MLRRLRATAVDIPGSGIYVHLITTHIAHPDQKNAQNFAEVNEGRASRQCYDVIAYPTNSIGWLITEQFKWLFSANNGCADRRNVAITDPGHWYSLHSLK